MFEVFNERIPSPGFFSGSFPSLFILMEEYQEPKGYKYPNFSRDIFEHTNYLGYPWCPKITENHLSFICLFFLIQMMIHK